jgi:hypothetical protein
MASTSIVEVWDELVSLIHDRVPPQFVTSADIDEPDGQRVIVSGPRECCRVDLQYVSGWGLVVDIGEDWVTDWPPAEPPGSDASQSVAMVVSALEGEWEEHVYRRGRFVLLRGARILEGDRELLIPTGPVAKAMRFAATSVDRRKYLPYPPRPSIGDD